MSTRQLSLPLRLTHVEAEPSLADLTMTLRREAGNGAEVVLDLAALETFDSSVVAVLLALRREADALGCVLRLQGMPTKLRDLTILYGVNGLLPA